MPLHCSVVSYNDDVRAQICDLINNKNNLQLVSVFDRAIAAKKKINQCSCEVLFVDLEMPNISGFDFYKSLSRKPHVIFISRDKKKAFDALQFNPIDFILYPIKAKLFKQSVDKATQIIETVREQKDQNAKYLTLPKSSVHHRIKILDIIWIEALGDYKRIYTRKNKIVIKSNMKSLEQQLPSESFLRIHKSYIVNFCEINNYNSREVDIAGKKLPISRKRKATLDAIFETF